MDGKKKLNLRDLEEEPVEYTEEQLAELADKAGQGDGDAALALGEWAEDHDGDFEKWYELAIDLGHEDGAFYLKEALCDRDGAQKAFERMLELAEKGDPYAQVEVGDFYDAGEAVEQDDRKAFEWFLKSAENGCVDGMSFTADCYEEGSGTEVNYEQAIYWSQKMAEVGNAEGMCNLGRYAEEGKGMAQNPGQAVMWYQKAADLDCGEAQYRLGRCYELGFGVDPDKKRAAELYRQAGKNGSSQGNFRIWRKYVTVGTVILALLWGAVALLPRNGVHTAAIAVAALATAAAILFGIFKYPKV